MCTELLLAILESYVGHTFALHCFLNHRTHFFTPPYPTHTHTLLLIQVLEYITHAEEDVVNEERQQVHFLYP